ncbi:hypothetical protein J1N35_041156 [Gossypium stocksii]|uniref:Uncharacterized protein n=1 Tax=Gossypium stocksii TaxID=47602 RepID=A0A9D3UFK8_9ROSI|nr:hypothetical protein J1N35_041156 [Gossypium stocksii]
MRRVYYHSTRHAFAIGLPVDRYVVTGSASSTDWGTSCRRIELGVCRIGKVVQGNVRGDATEQSQNRRLPITTAIMGTVSLSIFTSSSGPPIYISTNNEVEPFGELCRNTYLSRRYTTSIRPTIGQFFEWTPYDDPTIRAVIPDEYFQNPNVWHVKVPLVSYATMKMHQSDSVLRQFRS